MELLVRALLLLVVACTPNIGNGVFLCGPNESCPDGQTCDGETNACVTPVAATGFSCGSAAQTHDDDTPATATPINGLACVSPVTAEHGCFDTPTDTNNWYAFSTPAECTAVGIKANISFPYAFESLGLLLTDATGATTLATDTECTSSVTTGDATRCLSATLVPGTSYALSVKPTGEDNCDGDCGFNRYLVNIQLVTP
ncbi:MAG: hypothetical protein QM831_27755 [Kofleriaceae bacterium]